MFLSDVVKCAHTHTHTHTHTAIMHLVAAHLTVNLV